MSSLKGVCPRCPVHHILSRKEDLLERGTFFFIVFFFLAYTCTFAAKQVRPSDKSVVVAANDIITRILLVSVVCDIVVVVGHLTAKARREISTCQQVDDVTRMITLSSSIQFHAYSTKDHEGGDQTSMELRTNSIDDKINSTAHEPRGNPLMQDLIEDRSNLTYELLGTFYQDYNKRNVVPYEMCENSTCIPLCCPLGVRMIKDECIVENVGHYPFPGVYEQATNEALQRGPIGEVDQIFQLTVHDSCQKVGRYLLDPDITPDDAFMFLLYTRPSR